MGSNYEWFEVEMNRRTWVGVRSCSMDFARNQAYKWREKNTE